MRYVGYWLAIRTYKHDGTFHRSWDRCYVLENTDDYIVVANKKAKVTEANGRKWFTREPAITIFSKKEWWNAICMFKEDGIVYYCNIASPAIIEDGLIKYIDYDLDTKMFANGEIHVLDEKEYQRHKEAYSYSDDLDVILEYQTQKTVEQMKNHQFPFDDEKIKEYYQEFLKQTTKEDK